MKKMDQLLDMPNLGLDIGEHVQDIRDRQVLGLSAIAGYFEDKLQPDYPAFVRARWSRIDNVSHGNPIAARFGRQPDWRPIRPIEKAGRTPKNKEMAVIFGTEFDYEDDIWGGEDYDIWPAAAYEYRNVRRAGILPDSFGVYENLENAVAMLVGKNEFKVAIGTVVLRNRIKCDLNDIKRKDIKGGTLYIPDGLKVVDVLPAADVPAAVPLV